MTSIWHNPLGRTAIVDGTCGRRGPTMSDRPRQLNGAPLSYILARRSPLS